MLATFYHTIIVIFFVVLFRHVYVDIHVAFTACVREMLLSSPFAALFASLALRLCSYTHLCIYVRLLLQRTRRLLQSFGLCCFQMSIDWRRSTLQRVKQPL